MRDVLLTPRECFYKYAIMLLLLAASAYAQLPAAEFPERTPELMEECLLEAVENNRFEKTNDSYKYICSGLPAEHLWDFLEIAEVEPYEQDVGSEGFWLGRDFPLGGCFKRTRMADGTDATTGLSCTIWIPRRVNR